MEMRARGGALLVMGYALLVVGLVPRPAKAGRISMQMTASATIVEGQVVVTLELRNGGDEAALSVSPTLAFGDKSVAGVSVTSLAPGSSQSQTLTLASGQLGAGRWPYRVAVEYTDANRYPFHAVHVADVVVGSPAPAKVLVPRLVIGPLAGRGRVEVHVRNMGPQGRTATVAFYGPESIEARPAVSRISLEGWETETLSIDLVNRSALPGAVHPVAVVAEYDDESVHQSTITRGVVQIVAGRQILAQARGPLAAVAVTLVGVWLGLLLWRRRRRG